MRLPDRLSKPFSPHAALPVPRPSIRWACTANASPPHPFPISWAPAPAAQSPTPVPITAATAILSPGAACPEAYGAAVVLKTSGACTSLDVVGNSLPMPSDLDGAGYVVTVARPDSKPLVSSRLPPIPAGPGAWAGHVSGLDLPPMEKAAVSVFAATSPGHPCWRACWVPLKPQDV